MTATPSSIKDILATIPSRTRGPGGAIAVLKDGVLVGQQVWGYSDLTNRTPMTATTLMPICSITKQMLCGLLTDLELHPTPSMLSKGSPPVEQFSASLARLLPESVVKGTGLTMRHLCNNQSGLRDYWALTVLWGARPEGHFDIKEHGPQMLERLKSFHFKPGTEYSYANTNFFVIARVIEEVTGRELGELLQERVFGPAGMGTARLCAHASEYGELCVGYEGREVDGHYPGENCIEWAGDAGVVASLEDMIAYEGFVDRSSQGKEGWYVLNGEQQRYDDGTPSDYGFGLARKIVEGTLTIGHGGALRGYRLVRCYAPEPRLSVVVMMNEEHGDAGELMEYTIKQATGSIETKKSEITPSPNWIGTYLDNDTGLAVVVSHSSKAGELMVQYHNKSAKLRVVEESKAQSSAMTAILEGSSLQLQIPSDNRTVNAQRVASWKAGSETGDLQGEYHCAEIESVFRCSDFDGMVYGMFDGFLGKGPVHFMRPLGEDVWALACPRAMDSTPPGDWTVIVRRNAKGAVSAVTIGCWLARRLEFVKQ